MYPRIAEVMSVWLTISFNNKIYCLHVTFVIYFIYLSVPRNHDSVPSLPISIVKILLVSRPSCQLNCIPTMLT